MHTYLLKRVWLTAGLLAVVTSGIVTAQTISADKMPTEQTPLLNSLVKQAKESATKGYQPRSTLQNDALTTMSYETYKAIRFNPEKALWHNQRPFEVQLFHSGFIYQAPLNIYQVDWKNNVSKVPFDSNRFIYGPEAANIPSDIKTDIGYAGFRLHYPLNTSSYKDEFAVFQGATYFRLIGQNQQYGISARAVALNTGLPEGEEFPYFTDFWLIETDNSAFTVYGKIDSPSVTGVFKFVIHPGKQTKTDVEGWLFARQDIQKLGLAPFTSMFLHGENSKNKHDDYRPEVHDSDGIAMRTSDDQFIWRPLNNPNRLRITSLSDAQPKSFSMLQRDIQYSDYLDSQAHYQKRPGLTVTPQTGFNDGHLEIVEIPTKSETNDNIVAYWVNNKPVAAGDNIYVQYSLETQNGLNYSTQQAKVIRTLQGVTALPGEPVNEDDISRRFVVDFTLPRDVSSEEGTFTAEITASNAFVKNAIVSKTNYDQELRASFEITPSEDDSVVDMRMVIKKGGQVVSEAWTYVYE